MGIKGRRGGGCATNGQVARKRACSQRGLGVAAVAARVRAACAALRSRQAVVAKVLAKANRKCGTVQRRQKVVGCVAAGKRKGKYGAVWCGNLYRLNRSTRFNRERRQRAVLTAHASGRCR